MRPRLPPLFPANRHTLAKMSGLNRGQEGLKQLLVQNRSHSVQVCEPVFYCSDGSLRTELLRSPLA
jgi:hypothetical protein